MTTFIVRRLVTAIPVMLLVAVAVFLLLHMTPGDPVAVLLGPDATTDQIAHMRDKLGLNDPIQVQLVRWLGNMLHGNLGDSLFLGRTVTKAISERVQATVILTLLASAVAIVIGIPAGVVSAVRRGGWLDMVVMLVAMIGISMPTFWLGLNLIYLFGVVLHWLPVGGYRPISAGLWTSLRYYLMPAFTLGAAQAALLARMTRSMMLEVLDQDYIRTARAKGVRNSRVIVLHALRNALIPLVTIVGLTFAVLMGGAVVTEQVFNIPGVGRLLIEAVLRKDYPVVQGIVLVIALVYVVINLIVDVIYTFLDPRLRVR